MLRDGNVFVTNDTFLVLGTADAVLIHLTSTGDFHCQRIKECFTKEGEVPYLVSILPCIPGYLKSLKANNIIGTITKDIYPRLVMFSKGIASDSILTTHLEALKNLVFPKLSGNPFMPSCFKELFDTEFPSDFSGNISICAAYSPELLARIKTVFKEWSGDVYLLTDNVPETL